jgi:hypothetical protein
MHGFLRWIVTALYVVSLLFELLSAANAYADIALLPLVVLALTASYGILMLLLWLYERLPPQTEKQDRDSRASPR